MKSNCQIPDKIFSKGKKKGFRSESCGAEGKNRERERERGGKKKKLSDDLLSRIPEKF